MRRALAAALLGISLWIGALAWSGFVMTRTVLDPGRSEDVAEALLEDDAVRAKLVENISGGVAAGLPEGARVDPATLEAGAGQALESPEVQRLFLDAFVRSHQAFLGEGDPPDSLEGEAFGAAARDSVVDAHPELGGLLPEAPSLRVPLPTERIPDAGPVRRGLLTAVPILAAIAAVGAISALLVTSDRPAVIRRAGIWALGLSAFVLLFAYGVPALAQQVAPSQAEVVAALIGALAATTRGPALALAGAGVAGIVLSMLWRRRAAPASTPVAPAGHRPQRRDLPTPGRRPPARRPSPSRPPVPTPGAGPDPTRVVPSAAETYRAPSPPRPPSGTDATRVEHPAAGRSEAPAGDRGETRENARWVEGVGWVHDGRAEIPASARWVPGVGYVLED